MRPLPIDAMLADINVSLRQWPNLVLEAPPGAGKTTRVPPSLLSEAELTGDLLVLQPRRIAARMAARFVAAERGEAVGESIGYQVRFDERVGRHTRVRFITEALLLRRLLRDRTLKGTSVVLFDEFHERHLVTDVGLALCKQLQATRRSDLKLLVMSATLDAGPVATYLDDCPVLRSEGRAFEVALEYLAQPDERRLGVQVSSALAGLLRQELDGDVLVFLPGMREIAWAEEACAALAAKHDLLVLPLHGELAPEAQDRAVRPADRRKVILATNVAETSVTIDGVVAVIDSGLARVASHEPWSGLPTLKTRPISRASAAQRAGRAGRTRPGRCLRLYTRHDHDTRPGQDTPEIERADLAETLLLLAALDVPDATQLPWLTPPPAAALEAGRDLLRRLDAIDEDGRLTDAGRRFAALPLHPRQARIVDEAQRRGHLRAGCTVAALLGERDLCDRRASSSESGPSDLLALVELLDEAERLRFDPRRTSRIGVRAGRARNAARVRDQLMRNAKGVGGAVTSEEEEEAIGKAVLAGFPDRVARQRTGGGRRLGDREILLALGGSALLSERSVVHEPEWLVAVDAEQRGARSLVHAASGIEPDWLLELFPERVLAREEVVWNAAGERVERVSRLMYEGLALEESRDTRLDPQRAAPVLREAALARGPEAFVDAAALRALMARIELVRREMPELELETPDPVAALAAACDGCRSFAELRQTSLLDTVRQLLGKATHRLDELTPADVSLPGGRRLRVRYEPDKPPWAESFLQDFFGMRDGPRLVNGRVALTLHLLAPNRRAVQVTSDLANFWSTHYPELRRALSRRYPRHAWPEDPLTAKPPPPSGRRRRR